MSQLYVSPFFSNLVSLALKLKMANFPAALELENVLACVALVQLCLASAVPHMFPQQKGFGCNLRMQFYSY